MSEPVEKPAGEKVKAARPLKVGWLFLRQGKLRQQYKRRFCILNVNGQIEVYKAPEDQALQKRNSTIFDLHSAEISDIEDKEMFQFVIRVQKQSHFVAADILQDRTNWIIELVKLKSIPDIIRMLSDKEMSYFAGHALGNLVATERGDAAKIELVKNNGHERLLQFSISESNDDGLKDMCFSTLNKCANVETNKQAMRPFIKKFYELITGTNELWKDFALQGLAGLATADVCKEEIYKLGCLPPLMEFLTAEQAVRRDTSAAILCHLSTSPFAQAPLIADHLRHITAVLGRPASSAKVKESLLHALINCAQNPACIKTISDHGALTNVLPLVVDQSPDVALSAAELIHVVSSADTANRLKLITGLAHINDALTRPAGLIPEPAINLLLLTLELVSTERPLASELAKRGGMLALVPQVMSASPRVRQLAVSLLHALSVFEECRAALGRNGGAVSSLIDAVRLYRHLATADAADRERLTMLLTVLLRLSQSDSSHVEWVRQNCIDSLVDLVRPGAHSVVPTPPVAVVAAGLAAAIHQQQLQHTKSVAAAHAASAASLAPGPSSVVSGSSPGSSAKESFLAPAAGSVSKDKESILASIGSMSKDKDSFLADVVGAGEGDALAAGTGTGTGAGTGTTTTGDAGGSGSGSTVAVATPPDAPQSSIYTLAAAAAAAASPYEVQTLSVTINGPVVSMLCNLVRHACVKHKLTSLRAVDVLIELLMAADASVALRESLVRLLAGCAIDLHAVPQFTKPALAQLVAALVSETSSLQLRTQAARAIANLAFDDACERLLVQAGAHEALFSLFALADVELQLQAARAIRNCSVSDDGVAVLCAPANFAILTGLLHFPVKLPPLPAALVLSPRALIDAFPPSTASLATLNSAPNTRMQAHLSLALRNCLAWQRNKPCTDPAMVELLLQLAASSAIEVVENALWALHQVVLSTSATHVSIVRNSWDTLRQIIATKNPRCASYAAAILHVCLRSAESQMLLADTKDGTSRLRQLFQLLATPNLHVVAHVSGCIDLCSTNKELAARTPLYDLINRSCGLLRLPDPATQVAIASAVLSSLSANTGAIELPVVHSSLLLAALSSDDACSVTGAGQLRFVFSPDRTEIRASVAPGPQLAATAQFGSDKALTLHVARLLSRMLLSEHFDAGGAISRAVAASAAAGASNSLAAHGSSSSSSMTGSPTATAGIPLIQLPGQDSPATLVAPARASAGGGAVGLPSSSSSSLSSSSSAAASLDEMDYIRINLLRGSSGSGGAAASSAASESMLVSPRPAGGAGAAAGGSAASMSGVRRAAPKKALVVEEMEGDLPPSSSVGGMSARVSWRLAPTLMQMSALIAHQATIYPGLSRALMSMISYARQRVVKDSEPLESLSMPARSNPTLDSARCSDALHLSRDMLRIEYGPAEPSQAGAVMGKRLQDTDDASFVYFEVLIVQAGRNGAIGVGLATREHSLTMLPGWSENSVGYHGDDGNLYVGGANRSFGPRFTTGDVIGCGYDHARELLFFTKNGLVVDEVPEYKAPADVADMVPCVGLASPGEEVAVNFGATPFVWAMDILSRANFVPSPKAVRSETPPGAAGAAAAPLPQRHEDDYFVNIFQQLQHSWQFLKSPAPMLAVQQLARAKFDDELSQVRSQPTDSTDSADSAAAAAAAAAVVCHCCRLPLPAGVMYYACSLCDQWYSCRDCMSSSLAPQPLHPTSHVFVAVHNRKSDALQSRFQPARFRKGVSVHPSTLCANCTRPISGVRLEQIPPATAGAAPPSRIDLCGPCHALLPEQGPFNYVMIRAPLERDLQPLKGGSLSAVPQSSRMN